MELGDRMKKYEYVTRTYLTNRTPVIIRIDGRAFHTFTKGFKKPFDDLLATSMRETMLELCMNLGNCKFGYTQSDEISLVLLDTDKLETQPWFDNNLSKILSVSASIATLAFNKSFRRNLATMDLTDEEKEKYLNKIDSATFDARAFNIPIEEVNNYFIWRQQDCIRNSILMVAQSVFSFKEMQGKSCKKLLEMLEQEKNIDYELDYPTYLRRGTCAYKSLADWEGDGTLINSWCYDPHMPDLVKDQQFIMEKMTNDKML